MQLEMIFQAMPDPTVLTKKERVLILREIFSTPSTKHQGRDRCSLYLMRCGDWFKIGIARIPGQRLRDIQIGNPLEVTICKTWALNSRAAAERVESTLHKTLKEFRGRGEWFSLPEDVVNYMLQSEDIWTYQPVNPFAPFDEKGLVDAIWSMLENTQIQELREERAAESALLKEINARS